jgi:hypothetical protein
LVQHLPQSIGNESYTLIMKTLVLCAATVLASAIVAPMSNVALRYTAAGELVNAHSGGLYRFNDTFYLYGTAYQNCTQPGPICVTSCGYFNNVFVVYSSQDLIKWTLVSDNLVPEIAVDNAHIEYDEVNVGYCSTTGDFVMTFWSGHFGFVNSNVAVARSPTPGGPFLLAPPIVAVGGKVISDTVGLFVDDGGTAYVRYNTRDAPLRHVVERLNANWTATSGEFGVIFSKQDFPWYDGERYSAILFLGSFSYRPYLRCIKGGGMFRRGGLYYVMLSFDCCCEWVVNRVDISTALGCTVRLA